MDVSFAVVPLYLFFISFFYERNSLLKMVAVVR